MAWESPSHPVFTLRNMVALNLTVKLPQISRFRDARITVKTVRKHGNVHTKSASGVSTSISPTFLLTLVPARSLVHCTTKLLSLVWDNLHRWSIRQPNQRVRFLRILLERTKAIKITVNKGASLQLSENGRSGRH